MVIAITYFGTFNATIWQCQYVNNLWMCVYFVYYYDNWDISKKVNQSLIKGK